MKAYVLTIVVLLAAGCATHANITVPPLKPVASEAWKGKAFTYRILYRQPQPGLVSGGRLQPPVPLEQAELSVASAATLKKLPDYIAAQIPSSQVSRNGASDYTLVVEITAHHKKGPAYADYDAGKSAAKNLLSLGFAASEYLITADFDATYRLVTAAGEEVAQKSYRVRDTAKHQRSDFESINSLHDYAGEMLNKHLIVTLNDFFAEARP